MNDTIAVLAGLAPLVLLAVLIALYFLPTVVAHRRKAATRGTATVVNIFLGWTVIGWVVALAMAYGPTEPRATSTLHGRAPLPPS